jgi:hypothetical protein
VAWDSGPGEPSGRAVESDTVCDVSEFLGEGREGAVGTLASDRAWINPNNVSNNHPIYNQDLLHSLPIYPNQNLHHSGDPENLFPESIAQGTHLSIHFAGPAARVLEGGASPGSPRRFSWPVERDICSLRNTSPRRDGDAPARMNEFFNGGGLGSGALVLYDTHSGTACPAPFRGDGEFALAEGATDDLFLSDADMARWFKE